MFSLRNVYLFFWTLQTIDSQRWYTATLPDSLQNDFKPDSIQDEEERYMPVPTVVTNENNVAQVRTLGPVRPNKLLLVRLQNVNEITTPNPSTPVAPRPLKIEEPITNPPVNTKPNLNKMLLTNATTYHKRLQGPVWFNNTINNVNFLRASRPKRRILKRCPSTRSRQKKQLSPEAKSRFLDIFHVVEFRNVPCTSSSGLDGICLHEYECRASGGYTMGDCADGYGTCCITQLSCGDKSRAQTAWFTNPGFPNPSTERLSCAFALDKSSDDIRQIRLDLVTFELLPPTSGSCEQDQFVVTGQNINNVIPILCGINNGQHVYIEVGDVEGPIDMSVQTIVDESRLFAIRITQLTATDDQAAPTGCLQYYRGIQGVIESFNFKDKSTIVLPKSPSYFNNLNYAMCIERAVESCSITYSNMGNMEIYNYDSDGVPLIPLEQAGVEIFNCPSDWLLIAGARLCGDRLNDGSVFQDFSLDAPITETAAGPIVVWFRSDSAYASRGYQLQYQQNPCQNPA